ncbi:PEPL protein, partial [Amia calva]|nr:PEPL protein [Amia calva]
QDVNKINEGKPTMYQDDTNRKIVSSTELLDVLDQDAKRAIALKHPQAEMIEQDIKQLRERVKKLRLDHNRIYNITRSEGIPSVDWGRIIDEKQANLNNKTFGNDLPTVDNQVEEHNIFHSEVEAIGPHITDSDDKAYVSGLQVKYNKLLFLIALFLCVNLQNGSAVRQRDLHTLRDYMQRCTNELYWMDQQAEERINYDWSNANLDYPTRQKQYEASPAYPNFISKSLESKEATITKLHDDGEKLLASEHPGKNAIEAHMEAVHADWKEYLNLLICEENHLKHMEEYHKYHKDARDTQDMLKRMDTELNQKYSPEFKDMYQTEAMIRDLDDQAKAMDNYDERVKALQKRSQQVLPLKYRRETPAKALPVEALCEFESDEGQIARGEKYTLIKNRGAKWDVKDSAGRNITAPAVCFMIPPTDTDAIGVAENLANQQKTLKQKVSSSKGTLMKRFDELKKENTGSSDKQEQQCRQMMASLDKVNSDLDKQEKALYTRLRPPLEQSRPLQDSDERLQDLKDIGAAVRRIEPEKTSKVNEAETFLASKPKCASAPQLYSKVDEVNNKYNKVNVLLQCSEDKLQNSNRLENSLQKGKSLLSTYENKLAREEVAPADLSALERTQRELANLLSDIARKESELKNVSRNTQQYQQSIKDYETETEKFKSILDIEDGLVPQSYKRTRLDSPALKVKNEKCLNCSARNNQVSNLFQQAAAIESKFTEVSAVNKQRLQNLEYAQSLLNQLLNLIQLSSEKITIKEVLKVEKDVAFEREVENLRRQYEDEMAKNRSSQREQTDLLRKIQSLEEEKSKVIVQEKMREIVRPDPKAENEVANLRLELVEHQRRYRDADSQLRTLQDELNMLRNRGPQIEYKEIIKEVIKYKMDPETERELEKLRNEIVDKTHQTEKSELEIQQLRDEIQRWKDTKPQVQVKEVLNEVLQYREDPKTKEEVEILKRKLAEEQKKRMDLEREKSANEEKIRLRKIDLSQVREKVVQQEVVKMEEDHVLKSECQTFSQNINNEQKQKESLRDELYKLQRQKADLELQLEELERERRARRESELEIQRLRVRLNELEIRDKETREKEYSLLKLQVEEERHKRTLLEKQLDTLVQQHLTLERMEVREKVVRSEKVQVEKDPETELEIERLKKTLEEESKRRRELDQELSTHNSRLADMEFNHTKSSKELDYIREENSQLEQENQRLQNEIRKLQSEIQITIKETKHITESSPSDSGRNVELRLTSLQRELADLRSITNEKDREIEKLQKSLSAMKVKKEQRESHLRRSIVVIDPDTGKEMRPEEAYKLGLIDWKMFVNLQSQECDWEEISVKGPKGESSVLHDRKSGKKFSIDDALKNGLINNRQLQQYHNKELSIQEFGIMVSGRTK